MPHPLRPLPPVSPTQNTTLLPIARKQTQYQQTPLPQLQTQVPDAPPQTKIVAKNEEETLPEFKGEFVYLIRSGNEPYKVKICGYEQVKKDDYFTLSAKGITHYTSDSATFISKEQWHKEARLYQQLQKIPFFKRYQKWKTYTRWRKAARNIKLTNAAKQISESLLILDPHIRPTLLQTQATLLAQKHKLYKVQERTYNLTDLVQELKDHVSGVVVPELSDIRTQIAQSTFTAALTSLESAGFTLTEDLTTSSYTHRIARRGACARLSRFLRLTNYLLAATLQNLTLDGISDLVRATYGGDADLQIAADDPMPELSTLEILNRGPENVPVVIPPKFLPKKSIPLFRAELTIDLECVPSQQIFALETGEIINTFVGGPSSIEYLAIDWLGAMEMPTISSLTTQSTFFKVVSSRNRSIIDGMFVSARKCVDRLQPLLAMFKANAEFDFDALLRDAREAFTGTDPGSMIASFQKSFETYANDITRVKALNAGEVVAGGKLLLELTKLKDLILPSPTRGIKMMGEVVPTVAREIVDQMVEALGSYVKGLKKNVANVEEFIEWIAVWESAKQKMTDFEVRYEHVKSVYSMLEAFKVQLPPTDVAMYRTLTSTLKALLYECNEAPQETFPARSVRFSSELQNRLGVLSTEVAATVAKIQDPSLLDPDADISVITRMLQELAEETAMLREKGNNYSEWGSVMAVRGIELSNLDAMQAELTTRQTSWNTMKTFSELVSAWQTIPFSSLRCEEIDAELLEYTKVVMNLERSLPANSLVPKLKNNVEMFRKMYPTIVDLRSQALEPRHWERIRDIFGRVTLEEEFTLGQLITLKAFDFKEEIAQIASQAASEAGLQEMLAKVVKTWNDTVFTIITYRDYKDVFILTGVDEVQQVLDDSMITIATIKGSRFVAPIRNEVEKWDKALQLLGDTLEAWLTCQRNWLYLEPIFSAPDIQRQLPEEAKMFTQVDRAWRDIMRKVNSVPNALKAGTTPGLLEIMQQNNVLLEKIQKCLEDYLEVKRLVFPRFYFLSNDELLEILSQTRNPQAVQPHLGKCFDAVKSLEFSGETKSIDVLAMLSPEGERLPFGKVLKARGNVEAWLGSVEESMVTSIRKLIKAAIAEFTPEGREEWLLNHSGQVILVVSQILWCNEMAICLTSPNPTDALIAFKEKNIKNLAQLAGLVRGELTNIQRAILGALITIDVHARDIIQNAIDLKTSSINDFEWTKQLRYYWDTEEDDCFVRQSSSSFRYGYEYLGCSARLVITPLTDRCYLTLNGALALNLGGSPVGPAGTGKTETVKDLAKAIARQCVVFNCSDSLDYKMMGKFFAGLAQSGAWCCFDEFNRIGTEVLSVIAQQLLTIKSAKDAKVLKFMFENREIRLIPTCAAFITMNPGYAGRTELPDNLKALFRPIAMMIPDYGLIAEIMLFSEGFEGAKMLSGKVVNLYKLCSEQLSQQDHYDFGMRAVKSVLVMAGQLKRANPTLSEDVVLIRSLRDSNLPKFLAEDLPLFKGILQDLFPGVSIPDQDFGSLKSAIEEVIVEKGLTPVPAFIDRIIQLYDTTRVRHGVMLVGPTGGGKTTAYQVLAAALGKLRGNNHPNTAFQKVQTYVLNPKCITMAELYGETNLTTMEWHDGLIGNIIRQQVADTSIDEKWTVCDGPVDALWIENMNTVLDDNKLLCLANSERIKFNNTMHMLFEVADLAVASPATVSRCGMIYMDPAGLGWEPYIRSWLQRLPIDITTDVRAYVLEIILKYVPGSLQYVRTKCKEYVPSVNFNLVCSLSNLLETFFRNTQNINFSTSLQDMKPLLNSIFTFCIVWSIGGNIADGGQVPFDKFAREHLKEICDLSGVSDLYGVYLDLKSRTFKNWEDLMPTFSYSTQVPFFQMIVPTVDTVRFSYLLERLVNQKCPVLFTGETGVGKSVTVQDLLQRLSKTTNSTPLPINFSAQTSSAMTQQFIEGKLEKKRKNVLGAMNDGRVLMFVDDLNMPKLDTYGSQPPIELLRQYLDFGGFYDRDKLTWTKVQDVDMIAACAPPGGGRNNITSRFLRHFNMLNIPAPSNQTMALIFKPIIKGFLSNFADEIQACADPIINCSIDVYNRISKELLPTPAKSHYTFNLRDLSKVMQGILQVRPANLTSRTDMARLFCHEASRVFHDRLIDETDRTYFNALLTETMSKNFGIQISKNDLVTKPIMFGDFGSRGVPPSERFYAEFSESTKLPALLDDYLEEYNVSMSKSMRLIFFTDAQQHITRIARIIRQPRGNALLVGVSGAGKQSLTRLACNISEIKCFEIELTRSYGVAEWREDLRKLYRIAGVENRNTVFLITDSQIKSEAFLEDINSILNSGEIPGLFEPDEREKIIGDLRQSAREKGLAEDRDTVLTFFINRVRDNLHIVFATSPVGSLFRDRCRMFPSLVNCCTIDWYDEWPKEALLSVSQKFLELVDLGDDALKPKVAQLCVEAHLSVSAISTRYYTEARRRFYTTPTSYLELINLYTSMLVEKRKDITGLRDRLELGLFKLADTNTLVAAMQIELQQLAPELKVKASEVEILISQIEKDQATADAVKTVVSQEEIVVKAKAVETEAIAAEAQRDVDQALPALEAAQKALDSLDKKDIAEMKGFAKPPELVQTVMEAVCLLFRSKPDWDSSKKVLSDPQFLKKCVEYDKDNVPESLIKKLRKYIDSPQFTPEVVEKVSKAAKSLCMWVRAIDLYSRIFKDVEPKRKRLEEATQTLNETKAKLEDKQRALRDVEMQLEGLKTKFQESVTAKKVLQDKMDETTARLQRAGKLTSALANEEIRWKQSVAIYNGNLANLVGNIFLSAACVAYFGAFTVAYREELMRGWTAKCREFGIPVSDNFSHIDTLSDPVQVREWNAQGLPNDAISTENGILVSRGRRWPLMIDPQGQANRWIRKMEGAELKVIKLSEPKFLRQLENAIRTGQPVLLEDVGEQLDPTLEPLLLKQITKQNGRLIMKLGDSLVDYDKNFKLYITTKLANPHYLPEVCIKVTIINFMVTKEGLEGQLLADVVKLERPELETQRDELIYNISADQKNLKSIEDKILRMLYNAQGNILDDEELILTLNQSKITSGEIQERLTQAEETEKQINAARNKYKPVAIRGSVLYFVITDLSEMDPMYQFSLKYFKGFFTSCILGSEKMADLEKHIEDLCYQLNLTAYYNISRGLFEQHKLIFSFMCAAEILRQTGEISFGEMTCFLSGPPPLITEVVDKPPAKWLTQPMWKRCTELATALPMFAQVREHISSNTGDWTAFIESDSPYNEKLPCDNGSTFTAFQKLLIIKMLREEALIVSIMEFVKAKLGPQFIEAPPFDLTRAFKDASAVVPVIFVLSSGSDPTGALIKFANGAVGESKLHMISLGQGQGPIAEKLIADATTNGHWVYLQNCHLAASWMPKLEQILKDLVDGETPPHAEFRLILSSMPSKVFPQSILQDGVKLTNEPPKGLRANLARSFAEVPKQLYEVDAPQGMKFRKLLFGLCFFNAVIQERKKFGPLGWNIGYDWSNSDLEVSIAMLKQALIEADDVPWDALGYLTGEITFGGRVTDEWDRRTVRSILSKYYRPEVLLEGYKFSPSGIYFAPPDGLLSHARAYVESLPMTDEPEVFGMHENANVSYQLQESRRLTRIVLDVQSRVAQSGDALSPEELAAKLAKRILDDWPPNLVIDTSGKDPVQTHIFKVDAEGRMLNALSTVLAQEVVRYNKLLNKVRGSLTTLLKAVKGLVVMNSELELVFKSLMNNEVPASWAVAAYPSLKSLVVWVEDLHARIKMMHRWLTEGEPKAFWLPGFFFPQGFLTGVLQNHARKFNLPIDTLNFSHHMLPYTEDAIPEAESKSTGVIVKGIFLEGARWDSTKQTLEDALPMEMCSNLPLIRFQPEQSYKPTPDLYISPLYKTSARAGTLTTTGHSTNFVSSIYLPSSRNSVYWIEKGAALKLSAE